MLYTPLEEIFSPVFGRLLQLPQTIPVNTQAHTTIGMNDTYYLWLKSY